MRVGWWWLGLGGGWVWRMEAGWLLVPTLLACAARILWLLFDSELLVTQREACRVCWVRASVGGTFVRQGCALPTLGLSPPRM